MFQHACHALLFFVLFHLYVIIYGTSLDLNIVYVCQESAASSKNFAGTTNERKNIQQEPKSMIEQLQPKKNSASATRQSQRFMPLLEENDENAKSTEIKKTW